MSVNTLPAEIIYRWATSINSQTCKLWYRIWCTKPMFVTMGGYDAHINYKYADISLTALLKFKNLTGLSLCEHPTLDNIGPLTTLKTLYLGNSHNVIDTMLCKLTNITSLSLAYNQIITDISLRCLTKIIDLCLYDNKNVTNTMLGTLTNLTKLNVGRNNEITDDSLRHLTKLNHLSLKENKFVGDESITCLTNITYLSIELCDGVTNKSIRNLTNLTSIRLQCVNSITTLKLLPNLTELDLNLSYGTISDYKLGKMDNLHLLTIKNPTTANTSKAIGKLTKLETLRIRHSGCIKNRDLWELTNLRKLALGGCSGRRRRELGCALPNTTISDDVYEDYFF